ncbi:DUF2384 domain-containing protein [Paeniglutamicibacter antarcticus]|uniref:DUF2384 domain-containing protein n=2 Tax=Arthrobacter terrae TaxID=2935737 RepID=A0A931CPJ9_9MICC|nr:DUF2384 domain-containing protein [Arthrobacter terrae]
MAVEGAAEGDSAAPEYDAAGADRVGIDRDGLQLHTRFLTHTEAQTVGAIAERTNIVAGSLGGSAELARLMDVSSSQPPRWISGEETPDPENQRILIDLDYVLARANLLWPPKVALEWLNGPNSYLDGGRPIDVVKMRGPSQVIEALDAEMSGSFS